VDLKAVVVEDADRRQLNLEDVAEHVDVVPWSQTSEYFLKESDDGFDAGVCALFSRRIPKEILGLFARGIVNLHPSLLPMGRGRYPATWAIWQGEPYGASAHLMSEEFDAGPLVGQIEIETHPWDTSHSLYQRGVDALWDIYVSRVRPWVMGSATDVTPQAAGGTMHTVQDFDDLQGLARDCHLSMEDHVRLLRALSLGTGGGLRITQGGLEVEVQVALRPLTAPDERIR
jgi:folate-dependent phosphoribosylglycinamide formyltransferase PurN